MALLKRGKGDFFSSENSIQEYILYERIFVSKLFSKMYLCKTVTLFSWFNYPHESFLCVIFVGILQEEG